MTNLSNSIILQAMSFTKQCEKCGKTFIATQHNVKWCADCLLITCPVCGKRFMSNHPTESARDYGSRPPQYCSRRCAYEARRRFHFTKQELEELYYEQGLAITDIAKIKRCSFQYIYGYLVKFGIEIKPRGWHQHGSDNNRYGKTDHIKYPRPTRYKELDHFVRSGWEATFALWLKRNSLNYIYEPKVLPITSPPYHPDFYVLKWGRFVEIKGYWRRNNDKVKFLAFYKLFPSTLLFEKKAIKAIIENPNIKPKALLKMASSIDLEPSPY